MNVVKSNCSIQRRYLSVIEMTQHEFWKKDDYHCYYVN